MKRRDFISCLGLAALGSAAGVFVPALKVFAAPGRKTTTLTRPGMGTLITVTCAGVSPARAEDATRAAFAEASRLEAVLSRHRDDTPLAHLNTHGEVDAPDELRDVAAAARGMHGLTRGSYDPTVLPLIELVRKSEDPAHLAGSGDLARTMALVDGSNLRISGNRISLESAEMGLTLDGMAKGYIVDAMSGVLTGCGVENHLVNAGGDIIARGMPGTGTPWRVGIEDPHGKGHLAVFPLRDEAVATSGSYEQPVTHGFGHILNPKTGQGPGQLASSTVIAPTVMEADGLSTALFVQGARTGLTTASAAGAKALVLSNTGAMARTRNWPA